MEEGLLSTSEITSNGSRKWKLGGAALGLSLIGVLGLSQVSPSHSSTELDNTQKVFSDHNDLKSMKEESTVSPSIYLFTVDDMGWNDIGYNSGDLSEATPYMKTLAHQGITLASYYSQPSCTPSRVTIMTGKFAYKNGFQNFELQYNDGVGVPLSNKMMPAYFRDVGYKSIGFGKWNIGHCNSKYLPSERGFDRYLGYVCPGHGYTTYTCGHAAHVRDMFEGWTVNEDGNDVQKWVEGSQYLGTYDTLLYRDQSTAAIKKHFTSEETASTPMFMWLAHHGIHSEFDSDPIPPSELLTEENLEYLKVLRKRLNDVGSKEEEFAKFFKMRMITATVLMSLDNCLKTLVETIEELGQLSNSIIFVNSDNGGDVYYDKGHPGNNYPLRSEKFSYFEGGVRVPAFVFAPGHIPSSKQGATYHGLMHHVDLIATFFHLTGKDTDAFLAENSDLDSLNQWPAIIGDTTSPRTELVLNLPRSRTWKLGESETSEGVILRVGNYKMLINHAYDGWFSPTIGGNFKGTGEMLGMTCEYDFYTTSSSGKCVYSDYLFDIVNDPNEETNLWDEEDYKEIKAKMIARAEELVAAQTNDYGKIIPEAYEKSKTNPEYSNAFEAHDDFVVPWNCDVIV